MFKGKVGVKRSLIMQHDDDDDNGGGKTAAPAPFYMFKILLPNGMTVGLRVNEPRPQMPVAEFVRLVRDECLLARRRSASSSPSPSSKGPVNWSSGSLYFEDANDNKIRESIKFSNFKPHKCHILRLNDGSSKIPDTYENMWDLTPDTDILRELPEEYTFETALADLIDNSLQAVWSNDKNDRKFISVNIMNDKLIIFDTGPGMDSSEENSIVKWGKIGASLHRSYKEQAIGGKPPYLMPFFGIFGYGGPMASMHLGRRAMVSSKTKESKKVYTLHLERESLISSSGSELTWRTGGGMRDPTESEFTKSPHGSFTKVEILELKIKNYDIRKLQCKLKDIYFPYIQCDELSKMGRTTTPIKFQVNGVDLAGFEGGEVSITNLHSCNGPEFIFQLHLSLKQDNGATGGPGLRASHEANARLKCVYYPIVEGKENIDRILEKLKAEGCGVTGENYETFRRVSIRRLGRLIPDARWSCLPFMECKQKKGDKAYLLKRCCLRVKCFIDTDAGFNPTPSKTDLAAQNPFTIALKNFGNKTPEKERDVNVEIFQNDKRLSPVQLEKEYTDWILKMHDHYDEEIESGEDDPVLVVAPQNKKALGISSDVLRVHRVLKRKGASWKSGQRIKILKGACPGIHKKNVFATIEYFLIEGLQGDAGGDARIICRPLGVSEDDGCTLEVNNANASLNIRHSLSLPISVIDSGKCEAVQSSEWHQQLEKERQKVPSTIELLPAKHCQKLDIDGALPIDSAIRAGYVPPLEIVAVVRPASYVSSSNLKCLDERDVFKSNSEMSMEVNFSSDVKDLKSLRHLFSTRITPSSRKGFDGLYIFPLRTRLPELFHRAGTYTFRFSLADLKCTCEKKVLVRALPEVEKWRLANDKERQPYRVRVGSCFPPLSIGCYDKHDNQIPFRSIPRVAIKLITEKKVLVEALSVKAGLSSDNLTLQLKNLLIESDKLDRLRPSYRATLLVFSQDVSGSLSVPCQVTPGLLHHITAQPPIQEKDLVPGSVIQELQLEMLDAYGNHVAEGLEVQLNVDGFSFLDKIGLKRKVSDNGCIELGGVLKVANGFGRHVSISILFQEKVVFKQEWQTIKRELRILSGVPESCTAGSDLKSVVFQVVDSEGDIDETFHDDEKCGQSHSLTIKSGSHAAEDSIKYAFSHGCCTVRAIPIPQTEGTFSIIAAHSRFPELQLSVKLSVTQAPEAEYNVTQAPEAEYNQSPCSDGPVLMLQDSSSRKDADNMMLSIFSDKEGMVKEICRYGEKIGSCESILKCLHDQKTAIERELSVLQGSMDPQSIDDLIDLPTKEGLMERIKSTSTSAAAILCQLSGDFTFGGPKSPLLQDVVGIVALLGTVSTIKLSRILAEYLGEDQMLAVVCRSYEAASALEKYEENGEVDITLALHAEAAALGKSVSGRFNVICLEDIRPYTGKLEGDKPQRRLSLPNPILLPSGSIPPGFMGYAVNMVNLDFGHLGLRTAGGHSLRQTLFYRLFGELQVYKTREQMTAARACIKHGAVSVDGGILRENGVMCLGYRDPEICFPVLPFENAMHFSPEKMAIIKRLRDKNGELQETTAQIECVTSKYDKFKKKFEKKRMLYEEYMDNLECAKRLF